MALTEEIRDAVRPTRPRERWSSAVFTALGLALGIFLFYFAPYPIRHAHLPAGFDGPWYVWRATFVGSQGMGPVSTTSRPGHAILSAMLGSVTGRSQLQLVVVFSQLLPAMLALAVAGLSTSVTGRGRSMWVVTALVAGAVLGATRLVGENLANLLNVALEVGAVMILVAAAPRRARLWGSVSLLVAAGLAHWVFLAVFGVMLAATVGISVIVARRVDPPRSLQIRREARFLVLVGLLAAVIVAFLVGVVLRAPFRTFEIFQNSKEYAPKFITDLARLWPWALASALGLFALTSLRRESLEADAAARRSLAWRVVLGWALAATAGVVAGVATLEVNRFAIPPHRFLALLVAVPGVIVAGAGVWWVQNRVAERTARRAGRNVARIAGTGVVVGALVFLAVPSVIRWYRYPILMQENAVQQAETASQYVAQLPKGEPFVFVVDPRGPAVIYDAPLREREIRMALPSDRQEDFHLFVGSPQDLLAGRRSLFDPLVDRVTAPYWRDVSRVLSGRPPVLVVQALGPQEFADALSLGAHVIGPGVALLQGPNPAAPLVEGPPPNGVPPVALAVFWALVLVAVLGAAGWGWTALMLGSHPRPLVFVSLVPVVGAAALLLGAFLATEAGVRLHGVGGVATYVVVTVSGAASALLAERGKANLATRPSSWS